MFITKGVEKKDVKADFPEPLNYASHQKRDAIISCTRESREILVNYRS